MPVPVTVTGGTSPRALANVRVTTAGVGAAQMVAPPDEMATSTAPAAPKTPSNSACNSAADASAFVGTGSATPGTDTVTGVAGASTHENDCTSDTPTAGSGSSRTNSNAAASRSCSRFAANRAATASAVNAGYTG